MTTPDQPEFALVMRGYDRPQVDEFVAVQANQLGTAEQQRDAAAREASQLRREVEELRARLHVVEERELTETPKSLDVVGERVGTILRTAWEAADALRDEAQKEADALRAEAERAGRVEAETLLGETRRVRAELEAEVNDLTRRRDAVMAELEHLRSVLAGILGPAAVEGQLDGEPLVDLRDPERTMTTGEMAGGTVRRVI